LLVVDVIMQGYLQCIEKQLWAITYVSIFVFVEDWALQLVQVWKASMT
jgi:hypothetical protein